ncbi:MAG TPA: DUF177 domain-containing protein [Pseudolabrys sp.]|nr:DUF177 domain-containing protein [Pseudolabrys sp.]
MDKAGSPWTVSVAVDDIPDTGLHVDLTAPPEARAAVAALAGLRDLPVLAASFDLARRGAGLHVAGEVGATVGQTCVITLDPIENEVKEPIDVLFMPGAEALAPNTGAEQEGVEPPEPLIGGKVDLGALAVEFLLLGIDPYPRKPGVEFAAPKGDESGDHPFAGLEVLKKRLGGGAA